jgi:SHS family lactate transporter-like MFS transporter
MRQQKSVAVASYLGWTLDAFEFFVLVFVLKDIAAAFNSDTRSLTRTKCKGNLHR